MHRIRTTPLRLITRQSLHIFFTDVLTFTMQLLWHVSFVDKAHVYSLYRNTIRPRVKS